MKSDLQMLLALRRVLQSAAEGEGIARSVVEEMRGLSPAGTLAARKVLLGNPPSASFGPLRNESGEEVAVLASLIASAARSSVPAVGRNGGALAETLERWVKARESRALEQRVMKFRSLMTSAILGAVTGLLAALGPLVGSIQFSAPPVANGGLVYGAAAMTAVSSGMLGAYMSGRRFYVNVALSLCAFALVSSLASPLGGLSPIVA